MLKNVVAGVAGAGVFGGHHAAKYAELPSVTVAAIYDIDERRSAALARRFGATAFTNFNEFLSAVDVVTVAAPASTHFDIARGALERGRHVLVEKPVALRLDHAGHLIALAEEKNLILQTGHQERFVFEAFGILSRKRKPRTIRCTRANPETGRGEDVSVVFDLMIHDIDLVRRLDLGTLESVTATGGYDAVEATMEFAGGATVLLEANRLAPSRDRRMTLVYDDGVIEIDFVQRTIANSTGAALNASFDSETAPPALADPLGYGVARFIDAVRGGAPSPLPGSEGRDALEWALLVESETAAVRVDRPQMLRAGA